MLNTHFHNAKHISTLNAIKGLKIWMAMICVESLEMHFHPVETSYSWEKRNTIFSQFYTLLFSNGKFAKKHD